MPYAVRLPLRCRLRADSVYVTVVRAARGLHACVACGLSGGSHVNAGGLHVEAQFQREVRLLADSGALDVLRR
jgi:hypothetical protein